MPYNWLSRPPVATDSVAGACADLLQQQQIQYEHNLAKALVLAFIGRVLVGLAVSHCRCIRAGSATQAAAVTAQTYNLATPRVGVPRASTPSRAEAVTLVDFTQSDESILAISDSPARTSSDAGGLRSPSTRKLRVPGLRRGGGTMA